MPLSKATWMWKAGGPRLLTTFGQKRAARSRPTFGRTWNAKSRRPFREPLKQRIENELIYQNAAKNIPAASLAGMKKAIGKEFDKEQVPRLLKVFHVESRFELEANFRR